MASSLIIVPGHAIFENKEWHGGFYGDTNYFETHVSDGIRLWKEKGYTALAFSGGRTRPSEDLKNSEAEGMLEFARGAGLLESGEDVLLESFARDSFENVFFSLLLFHKEYGAWPEKVGIASWPFKTGRFKAIAAVLKLPAFEYYPSGELKDAELVEKFRKINEEYDAKMKEDPLHRSSDFAATRMQRVPPEFKDNESYLAAVKHAYGNGELINRIENITPSTSPVLPW